jgi:PAS domain S-box-containing protein
VSEFRSRLADILRPIGDPDSLKTVASRFLGEYLGASRVLYGDVLDDDVHVEVTNAYVAHDLPALSGRIRMADYGAKPLEFLRQGRSFRVADVATSPLFTAGERVVYGQFAVASLIAAPLMKAGRLVAVVCVHHTEPRDWMPDDEAIVQEAAERSWTLVRRVVAQTALRDSKQRYRSLIEGVSDALALCEAIRDASGRMVDYRWIEVNAAYEQLIQLHRSSLIGKRRSETTLPSDPELMTLLRSVVESQRRLRMERYMSSLGSWVRFTAFPQGRDRFAVIVFDITERKRREERRTILADTARCLTESTDIQTTMLRLCEIVARHFGAKWCSFAEVNGAAANVVTEYEWHDPEVRPFTRVHAAFDGEVLAGVVSPRGGSLRVCHDCRKEPERLAERWSELSVRSFVDLPLHRAGRWRFQLWVGDNRYRHWREDETALLRELGDRISLGLERAHAVTALRESEARFRAVADLVPELLWQSEADGSTPWYNARWFEYTGQTPEEAQGWGWTEAIHPDDRPQSLANFHRALERREPLVQEHRIRRRDGTYRWFLMRAEPLRDASGRIVRWFGAATDIDAQRTAFLEIERLVGERTSERDTLRRQLTGAEESERRRIARELHDQLGQQLTAFAWAADEALRLANRVDAVKAPAEVPLVRRLESLQALAHATQRSARYLALELHPPELDDVGLESALQTYVDDWGTRYGIRTEVAVTGDAIGVPTDIASAFYRIAQEALTNVAKHAGATSVSLLLDKRNDQLRLIVEDNGKGFDVDATLERSRNDRRLGLAGIGERVRLLGGTLDLESRPAHGTSIYVCVPLVGAS